MVFKRKILVSVLTTFIICGVTLGFAYGLTTYNINSTFTNNSKSTDINGTKDNTNTVGSMILYVANTMIPPVMKNGLSQEIRSNISTSDSPNKSDKAVVNPNTNVAGPDEQSVDSKFQEIKNIPYNEQNMNCETKSKLFADYLIKNGGKGVNLVVIEHDSGKYSHEFVEWNGHYYDACNTKISYTMSKDDYLKQLQKIGFTGLIITTPYTG